MNGEGAAYRGGARRERGKRRSRLRGRAEDRPSRRLDVRHPLGARCRARASTAWTLSRAGEMAGADRDEHRAGRAIRSWIQRAQSALRSVNSSRCSARGPRSAPRSSARRAARRRRVDQAASIGASLRADLVDARRASRAAASSCCASGMRVEHPDLALDRLRARRSACCARAAARRSTVSGPFAALMPSCWAATRGQGHRHEPGLEPVERAGGHAERRRARGRAPHSAPAVSRDGERAALRIDA